MPPARRARVRSSSSSTIRSMRAALDPIRPSTVACDGRGPSRRRRSVAIEMAPSGLRKSWPRTPTNCSWNCADSRSAASSTLRRAMSRSIAIRIAASASRPRPAPTSIQIARLRLRRVLRIRSVSRRSSWACSSSINRRTSSIPKLPLLRKRAKAAVICPPWYSSIVLRICSIFPDASRSSSDMRRCGTASSAAVRMTSAKPAERDSSARWTGSRKRRSPVSRNPRCAFSASASAARMRAKASCDCRVWTITGRAELIPPSVIRFTRIRASNVAAARMAASGLQRSGNKPCCGIGALPRREAAHLRHFCAGMRHQAPRFVSDGNEAKFFPYGFVG